MQDHEIVAVTWGREGDPVEPTHDNSGPIIDVAQWKLSSGEPVSPLVWSAALTSPLGENLARSNIRCVVPSVFPVMCGRVFEIHPLVQQVEICAGMVPVRFLTLWLPCSPVC